MMSHGMNRSVRQVSIKPVRIQREAGDGADGVADLEALDVRPDRGNGPRRLVSQTGGKPGFFQVLTPAEHRLRAVQPERLDADLHFAPSRRRDGDLLDAQHFRITGLVKSYDS